VKHFDDIGTQRHQMLSKTEQYTNQIGQQIRAFQQHRIQRCSFVERGCIKNWAALLRFFRIYHRVVGDEPSTTSWSYLHLFC
jgi:hypothetical protein